jgi:pterin-4a-carbinolamine dehydratase
VIDYSTLIQTAGARANAADSNEARQAVEAVVTVVALALDDDERGRLADVLPGALRGAAALPGPATPVASSAALVRTVSERSGCPAERARFYTQAVLATVADAEPEVAELIARRLPDGHDLFSPIDQGVTARGSGVPTRQSPRILDRDEIARQLDGLTGWEGDELRLRRTVVLPPDRVRPLRDAVGRVERELDHHARVTQDQGAVTFEVWTHSLDRVTDMDVELARRINRAVEEIGASG